jgi:hypothetical protein
VDTNGSYWRDVAQMERAEHVCSARVVQTSTCSAIARASSTSMPRYRTVTLSPSLCLGLFTTAAWAALKLGDATPDFAVDAALGGKEFKFSLAEPLKRGPVVLYFYPKSFTSVCTIEAHEFAESIGNFTAAGASVTQRSRSKNSAAMDRCYDLDRTLNSTRSDRR